MLTVSNSSPLIYLAKGGLLPCLKELFGEIYVCEGVYRETVVKGVAGGYKDAKIINEAISEWIKVKEVKLDLFGWLASEAGETVEGIRALFKRLSRVDVEAISLAVELRAHYLLLDDRAAIKAAKAIQRWAPFTLLGTGDILERALKAQVISKAEYTDFLKTFGRAVAWVK